LVASPEFASPNIAFSNTALAIFALTMFAWADIILGLRLRQAKS